MSLLQRQYHQERVRDAGERLLGHAEIVRLLLEKGAKPDATTSLKSAVRTASCRGFVDVIQTLLQHGCNVNTTICGELTRAL